jgi:lipopolysaccharide export system permease protein
VFSTVERYLVKEVALTFVATVLILLAMVLSNRLVSYLNQVASGLLSKDSIITLLGLQAIRFLVVVVPLGFLLSTVLALGRLHRDSEMVALTACGVGPGSLYRSLFGLAIPLAAVLTALSFYAVPLSSALQHQLLLRARQEAEVSMFTPGTFREVANGKQVIYVETLSEEEREIGKVFIQSEIPGGIAITTGERGYQQIDPESGVRYLILENGYRYEGNPGQGDYQNMHFQRLSVRVNFTPAEQTWHPRETIPSRELLQSTNSLYVAEFHRRLSGPMSLLVLAFLAPLLAYAHPKEGRYGRIVVAVLIYAIYSNLLEIGQSWLARGQWWSTLGLWWVHGALLMVGVGLWVYQYGIAFWPFTRFVANSKNP